MKSVCLAVEMANQNNKIFTSSRNWIYNFKKDDANFGFSLLKKELEKSKIYIGTQDHFKTTKPDICIHFTSYKQIHGKINYFLLPEHELIVPENKKKYKDNFYDKIFCQYDKLIDNKRIFKLSYPFSFDPKIDKEFMNRPLLSSMIASNKSCKVKSNKILYQKRYEIINWFERNANKSFQFYGADWQFPQKQNGSYGRIKNYINRKFNIQNSLKTYKGTVKKKSKILSKTKFTFCIENIEEDGYVSDIIFDAFNNGSIPIYLGPLNIKNYIPEKSFIDLRKFTNFEDLFIFLKNYSKSQYNQAYFELEKKIKKINKNFSNESFVNILLKNILNDLKKIKGSV